jgi:hypothetical protein
MSRHPSFYTLGMSDPAAIFFMRQHWGMIESY